MTRAKYDRSYSFRCDSTLYAFGQRDRERVLNRVIFSHRDVIVILFVVLCATCDQTVFIILVQRDRHETYEIHSCIKMKRDECDRPMNKNEKKQIHEIFSN